jgi:hypothetical protein
MLVKKITLPQNSLFNRLSVKYHYTDSYAIQPDNRKEITPEIFGKDFFSDFPKWVHFMMRLRNILVKPFDITTGGNDWDIKFEPVQKGSSFSFLTVLDFNSEELLLFAPDNHLDTWISIMVIPKGNRIELIATTIVKYNNFTGRCYFAIIKIFHRLIVRWQLRHVYLDYCNNQNTIKQ